MIAAWAIPELRRRLLFIFAMFGIYVVGLHIPSAKAINHQALKDYFNQRRPERRRHLELW